MYLCKIAILPLYNQQFLLHNVLHSVYIFLNYVKYVNQFENLIRIIF